MPTWIWVACIKVPHSSSIVLKKLPASVSSTSSTSSWASLPVEKFQLSHQTLPVTKPTASCGTLELVSRFHFRIVLLMLPSFNIFQYLSISFIRFYHFFYITLLLLSCIHLTFWHGDARDFVNVQYAPMAPSVGLSHPWALHSQHSEVTIIVVLVNGYRPWEFSGQRWNRWNWHESTPHITSRQATWKMLERHPFLFGNANNREGSSKWKETKTRMTTCVCVLHSSAGNPVRCAITPAQTRLPHFGKAKRFRQLRLRMLLLLWHCKKDIGRCKYKPVPT